MPHNVTVSTDATTGSFTNTVPYTYAPPPTGAAIVNATLVSNWLAANAGVILDTGSDGGDPGDVTVTAAVDGAAGNGSLQLQAARNVVLQSSVSVGAGATLSLAAQAGGITQTLGSALAAASLSIVAGGGVTLNASGNSVTTISAVTANGDVLFSDSSTLSVAGPVNVGAHAATFTATGLTQTAVATLTAASASYTATNGNLTLAQQSNVSSLALTANNGDVALNGATNVSTQLSVTGSATSTISGVISGPGALLKNGVGTLTLTGANLYTGGTTLLGGITKVSADANLGAASGGLSINGTLEATQSFTSTRAVTVSGPSVVVVDTGQTLTLSGPVARNGDIFSNAGAGTLILSGTTTGNGFLEAAQGTLVVDGASAGSQVVLSSGVFGGVGTVSNMTAAGGGAVTVAPGDVGTTGVLHTGALRFNSHVTLAEQIGGATAGTGYDQLDVTLSAAGAVTLADATLNLSVVNGFTPANGQTYVIINNEGSSAVVGQFAGLAEGATVTLGGVQLTLSYHGGDGNDVTLSSPAAAPIAPATSPPPLQPQPVISGAPASQTYAGGMLQLAPGIVLSDAAATQLLNVQVFLAGYQSGDVLSAAVAGTGVTASFSPTLGALTLQGTASLATYNQILQSLSFSHTGANTATARTVTIQATDTAGTVGTVSEALTVPPASSAPTTAVGAPSQQAGYAVQFANLSRAAVADPAQTIPGSSLAAQAQAEAQIAAKLDADQLSAADAQSQLFHLVDGTTSLAELSYAFFTGRTPTAAGLNYLVNSPLNPTDLNDAYYQGFTTENRYINFAVNLATGQGAGAAAFQAAYGALSLSDAVTKAYAQVFGSAPAAGKVDAILNAQVPNGLGGTETRAQYFADVSGGTAAAQKAAAIGFLLADALKENLGPYATADQNFLADLAHGTAQYNVDLVGAYSTPHTLTGPVMTDATLGS